MTAWSDAASEPCWIYALPGSSLVPGLAAGRPALDALEGQPSAWRALLVFGPPPLSLADLAVQGGDLEQWRRQLQLAGQLKRRHRQRVTLLNTATLAMAERTSLQREWPELTRAAGGAQATSWPEALLTLAAQTVLRLDPALRAAYLDLEAEADGVADDPKAPWRHEPRAEDWLQVLQKWDGRPVSRDSGAGERSDDLKQQLRRQDEWLQLLRDQETQLEAEMTQELANTNAMAALLPRLEAQLARARRALEQAP